MKEKAFEIPIKEKDPEKTRLCVHCRKEKTLKEFNQNKDWEKKDRRDIWCKECLQNTTSKDGVKEYFWDNNRVFTELIWEEARDRAAAFLADKPIYNNATAGQRTQILIKATCQQIRNVMNLEPYYEFVENDKDIVMTYQEMKKKNKTDAILDENEKLYSSEFNGSFTVQELQYLEKYYASLEHDYDLDTENYKDCARKVAKASLMCDEVEADFAAGKCEFSVVKDAHTLFDMLNKSANFAACKRKADDKENAQALSVSEITYTLETTGKTCTKSVKWPQDDIDQTITDFSHIVKALGING